MMVSIVDENEKTDFSVFSTKRLEELKKMALQLGFLDDVVLYEMELRKRQKRQ